MIYPIEMRRVLIYIKYSYTCNFVSKALEEKVPSQIVTIATLTGHAIIAVGPYSVCTIFHVIVSLAETL